MSIAPTWNWIKLNLTLILSLDSLVLMCFEYFSGLNSIDKLLQCVEGLSIDKIHSNLVQWYRNGFEIGSVCIRYSLQPIIRLSMSFVYRHRFPIGIVQGWITQIMLCFVCICIYIFRMDLYSNRIYRWKHTFLTKPFKV